MATADLNLKLDERSTLGKGMKRLRRDGFVPAVIHDHGNPSVHAQAATAELLKIYRSAGKNHPVELTVGDRKFLALIKEASFRPPKHTLQHMVFQAIKQNETVEADVPVTVVGTPPAELTGHMILTQLDTVKIEALPRNLPDNFEVDAEKLVEIGDRITVADVKVPEGVTILTELEHPIASVVETRAMAAEEADEAAEAEDEAAEAGGEEAAPAADDNAES